MKVLFVSNLYPPNAIGGYERLCHQVAREFAAGGHEVAVLTSTYGDGEASYPGHVVYRRLRLLADSEDIYRPFEASTEERQAIAAANQRQLHAVIASERPDVIFAWNLFFVDPSLLDALGGGCPVVYMLTDNWLIAALNAPFLDRFFQEHVFGSGPFPPRPLDGPDWSGLPTRWLREPEQPRFALPQRAIFGAEFVRRLYAAAGVGFRDSAVIHNGVKLIEMPPEHFADRTRLAEPTELRLLLAGRVVDLKGVHTAIEALPHLGAAAFLPRIRLTILGDRQDKKYHQHLIGLIAATDTSDFVSFAEPIAESDLFDLFQRHDIYLFPSLYEPFSLTLIHALAAGIPTIASNAGGNPEIVHDGKSGLLFHKGDAADLARAIRTLAEQPALRQALSQEARRIAGGFTFERMVREMAQYLAETVAATQPSRAFALDPVFPSVSLELERAARSLGGQDGDATDLAISAPRLNKTPDLSIIMPTYNRGSLMESSIVQYLRCSKNVNAELIVIDDGSKDDTPDRLKQLSRAHSNIVVDRVPNSGPARARNLAASMARGRILVFVGDDVQPIDQNFLAFHLSAHQCFPNENQAVLGKIAWPEAREFPVNFVMSHIQGVGGQQFSYKILQPYSWYDWRYFYSSNVSVKRTLVSDWINDGYDSSFFYAALEDPEFALRMTKRYQAQGTDFRIYYVPAAALVHFHPYTVESFLQRQVSVGMMAHRFLELHPERATDLSLEELIRRLHDNSENSNLLIDHYLSIFEGLKSWAMVIEDHNGLGSQNWHDDLLQAIFQLAYFEGYIRSRTDSRLNYANACRYVLDTVRSSLSKAIFTELLGDNSRPHFV
jgi:glycogen(starch) synthase